MRLIGHDRTLERGRVEVYWNGQEAFVTVPGIGLDTRGLPMGLRSAPMGTQMAARALMLADDRCKQHASKDFVPLEKEGGK